jgi:AcrR family transcriptional regulator
LCAATTRSESGEVARHIARTAARLFAEGGYDGTPVSAIVEAAGVTKPTLYYHFRSKEGLAQALLIEPMARLAATLQGVLATEADPVRALGQMIAAHFDFTREEPDRSRFLFALAFGPHDRDLAAELEWSADELGRLYQEAVGRLAATGIIEAGRVEACGKALWGLIVIHILQFLKHCQEGEALGPDLAVQIVRDLLWGFAAPGIRTEKGRA